MPQLAQYFGMKDHTAISHTLKEINELLETSMNEISGHFSKLTENTREIEKEVDYVNSALDLIKKGKKEIEIPQYIEDIAAATTDKATAKSLRDLSKKIQLEILSRVDKETWKYFLRVMGHLVNILKISL